MAKGRLLGVQFDALFTDGLYWELSRHAIEMAEQLKKILRETGCTFYLESPTNQQFPVLPNGAMETLAEQYSFEVWARVDADHTAVRFCTSWSTTDEDVDALIADIQRL